MELLRVRTQVFDLLVQTTQGAANQVALAPRSQAPNPFSPTATLSQQFTPSNPQGSADVDERLKKLLEALGEEPEPKYQSRAMELAESLARDASR